MAAEAMAMALYTWDGRGSGRVGGIDVNGGRDAATMEMYKIKAGWR